MLIACWSAKGGAGTTVVTSSLALLGARRHSSGVVLADLAGDVPGILGLPEPDSAGLAGWLRAGDTVPADALTRLEVEAGPDLHVLPRGRGALRPERAQALAALLQSGNRPVVTDCGNLARSPVDGAEHLLSRAATRSLLVTRPCYLSLRHARELPVRPTAAIAVLPRERGLGVRDIEQSLGVPVIGQVPDDPAVGRAINAGLLASRLPRVLARGLRHAL